MEFAPPLVIQMQTQDLSLWGGDLSYGLGLILYSVWFISCLAASVNCFDVLWFLYGEHLKCLFSFGIC